MIRRRPVLLRIPGRDTTHYASSSRSPFCHVRAGSGPFVERVTTEMPTCKTCRKAMRSRVRDRIATREVHVLDPDLWATPEVEQLNELAP